LTEVPAASFVTVSSSIDGGERDAVIGPDSPVVEALDASS